MEEAPTGSSSLQRIYAFKSTTNMASDENNESNRELYYKFMEDSCCTHFCMGPNPSVARYVYGLIFLVTSLLAWTLRDYGLTVLAELQLLKGCQGAKYCLGAEGVLRVSSGCFIFFSVMFLSTAGTKKLKDPRNSWHCEWWPVKIITWLGLLVIPFLVPSPYIELYDKIAHFGAGVFLLIQLVSVISFITWLNDCCRSGLNRERCRIPFAALAVAAHAACFAGVVLMYIWYAPESSCILNISFITSTWVLLLLMNFVSLHPKVKAGPLAPGFMGIYIVFLCWSAIRSEPATEVCDRKAQPSSKDWLTIMAILHLVHYLIVYALWKSFVIAVLVIVMATFSTGIDSKAFQFKRIYVESEEEVPYGYGFFHFVFAMGAMYFAMLFIGWNSNKTMKKWTIDVGWTSTWVKMVNEWLATLVYIWMMVAPVVWKSRMRQQPTFQENEA